MSKFDIKTFLIDKGFDYCLSTILGGGGGVLGFFSPIVNTFGKPLSVMVGLTIGLGLFCVIKCILFERREKKKKPKKLEDVNAIKYSSQTVILDKRFINCEFQHCTLQYNGDDFEFYKETNKVYESCKIHFNTEESRVAVGLINGFILPFIEGNGKKKFILMDKYGVIQKRAKVEVDKKNDNTKTSTKNK